MYIIKHILIIGMVLVYKFNAFGGQKKTFIDRFVKEELQNIIILTSVYCDDCFIESIQTKNNSEIINSNSNKKNCKFIVSGIILKSFFSSDICVLNPKKSELEFVLGKNLEITNNFQLKEYQYQDDLNVSKSLFVFGKIDSYGKLNLKILK